MNEISENNSKGETYKHVAQEKIRFTVDPKTKELTSKPSKLLVQFLKEGANLLPVETNKAVVKLIEIGVFVKVPEEASKGIQVMNVRIVQNGLLSNLNFLCIFLLVTTTT